MTATLTMVPLAKIKTQQGFNPRTEFADDRMAELVESVKRHGIITPLTLAPDGDGGFVLVAGERRLRAAKAAKLKEVPAQVREGDGESLSVAVAENVIRADLSPVEEAEAYRRLMDEHGDAAKVAKLVGRSEKLIGERLELLRLPDEARARVAARTVPLSCAPWLVRIAEREPLLADLTAAWLAEHPAGAAYFPGAPGEVVDDVLAAEWQEEDGQPVQPVAYSGGYHGPILPGKRDDALPTLLAKLGAAAEPVAAAFAGLPEIRHASEYDWEARDAEQQRYRACFALDDEDADAARAFGCLLELPTADGRAARRYVTDAEWLADRLTQKIAAHAAAESERQQRRTAERRATTAADDPEKEARRQERQRHYDERVAARARNLDLGAALARWEPKLDTAAVKLLGSLVLAEHGRSAAWAYRLCVEQPTTSNKQGKVAVRYPRGAEAERQHHADALAALRRARTPEAALAVVLRLLVAQRLADPSGLANADRQGVYEPQVLAESDALSKLAARVAPPSVKRHMAEQEAERASRERAYQEQQQARLNQQRDKLAAGEYVRCPCCGDPIESEAEAAEKHGELVHAGDCEQQWGSALADEEEAE
jgi:ParB/RepB/Spo0J family partition protein